MCEYNIIALTGIKRSGKDVVADYISQNYGYKHVKISSKLKSVVKTAFDLVDDDVESSAKDEINKRLGVTPRRLMDFLGTHVFQYEINKIIPNMGRTYWIKDLLDKHKSVPLVISDLRFEHELDQIKQHSPSLILKIDRNNDVDESYVSETEINSLNYDYKITNDKTLQDLFKTVDKLLMQQ